MACIRYPYAVKCGGVYYAPHALIEVKNAQEHLERGAVEVNPPLAVERRTEAPERPKKRASGK